MKRVTALFTVLSVCAYTVCGCAGGTSQTNETQTVTESTAETEEPAAKEKPAATEEPTATEEPAAAQVELTVFAAASMTETMEEIAKAYKDLAPNVTIIYNFDSSGTLKTQIEEGADCDIFISAAAKQMNQLDITKDEELNPDGLDFIDPDTRIDLLENKVALAVPEGNPKNINSYDDMVAGLKDKSILMAMGNEDVPVGQYTQKIFTFYGLDEEALNKDGVITYGSNVKEVTTQVSEASVDCGVIYSTDAFSAGLTVVDTATKDMCGQVVYPAAVLKGSKHPEEARAFLDYLTTAESSKIFESVGFACLK
ncbi:MAG: molybdate ABC transporter substrate-binding protein [Lachnospiraceae bacterium]|nr:molybdate ABC transporter substrate-binding protein [Lachnospiraceae bacterium]